MEGPETAFVLACIKNLNAGIPLTDRQTKWISLLADEDIDLGFAATWGELAGRLGVTRRAIQEWRKDPRFALDCPPDRADGRKVVSFWASFMIAHGISRAPQD
jgi:hypothetical protein